MFEACKTTVIDIAGFIRKGESYIEKWSIYRKKWDLYKQNKKELGLDGVRVKKEF